MTIGLIISIVTLILLLVTIIIPLFLPNDVSRRGKRQLLVGTTILIVTALSLSYLGAPERKSTREEVLAELAFEDSVYNYIIELNIQHPDIVFRQAILESGNFKSKVFKDNNNMFGFKQAFKRANTQTGTNRGYAVYNSWQECVIDYALYQTYSAKNMTEDNYIDFLGRNYAEDPEYKNKISN